MDGVTVLLSRDDSTDRKPRLDPPLSDPEGDSIEAAN